MTMKINQNIKIRRFYFSEVSEAAESPASSLAASVLALVSVAEESLEAEDDFVVAAVISTSYGRPFGMSLIFTSTVVR